MTSTGKKARKRYGNRFAAKQRRDASSKTKGKGTRKRFGHLPFSVQAKNAPEGAVRANDELMERIGSERAAGGWDQDANVAVPGPSRASVEVRIRAEEQAVRAAARKAPRKVA